MERPPNLGVQSALAGESTLVGIQKRPFTIADYKLLVTGLFSNSYSKIDSNYRDSSLGWEKIKFRRV